MDRSYRCMRLFMSWFLLFIFHNWSESTSLCCWNQHPWRTSHLCSPWGTSVCIFTSPLKFLFTWKCLKDCWLVALLFCRGSSDLQIRGLLLAAGKSYVWASPTLGACTFCFTKVTHTGMCFHRVQFCRYLGINVYECTLYNKLVMLIIQQGSFALWSDLIWCLEALTLHRRHWSSINEEYTG